MQYLKFSNRKVYFCCCKNKNENITKSKAHETDGLMSIDKCKLSAHKISQNMISEQTFIPSLKKIKKNIKSIRNSSINKLTK